MQTVIFKIDKCDKYTLQVNLPMHVLDSSMQFAHFLPEDGILDDRVSVAT